MEEEHAAREAERERVAQEEAMQYARAEQARADEEASKQAHLAQMLARPGAADTPAMRAVIAQLARTRQQHEERERTGATHGAYYQSPNQSRGYSSARPTRSSGWATQGAAGNPLEGYSSEVLQAAEAKARADLRATGIDVDNPALRYLVEGRMVMDLRGQKPRAR